MAKKKKLELVPVRAKPGKSLGFTGIEGATINGEPMVAGQHYVLEGDQGDTAELPKDFAKSNKAEVALIGADDIDEYAEREAALQAREDAVAEVEAAAAELGDREAALAKWESDLSDKAKDQKAELKALKDEAKELKKQLKAAEEAAKGAK